MTGNVINVNFSKSENNVYEVPFDKLLAVCNKTSSLTVGSMTPRTFMLSVRNGEAVFNREELSEFLWMAAYMLDSEQRWCPKEMPAINYPEDNGE